MPFGEHPFGYAEGSVLPSRKQAELDTATAEFYDSWKNRYLGEGCGKGRAYVRADFDEENLTLSEAHGYGMILSAFMAGHDAHAKQTFDALFEFLQDHPTTESPELMAWYVSQDCAAERQGEPTAESSTDGDLDLAYALLLADKQWGSCGAIDYRGQALQMLEAIVEGDLNEGREFPLVGNWVFEEPWSRVLRTSDFMPDHFRSFAEASGRPVWERLTPGLYEAFATVQREAAPATGLLPEYVLDPMTAPAPAGGELLGAPEDDDFFWNACRVPLRIGLDFLLSGDTEARAVAGRHNAWIRAETEGDPLRIASGYALDGTVLPGWEGPTMAFVAPFAVSAMVDPEHGEWLDALWDALVEAPPEAYYPDSLKLLSLVALSGNWWAPEWATDPCR